MCRRSPVCRPDPPAAVFFYSPDRGGEHPEQHLADYAGLTDAYAGFSKLYEVNRKAGPILAAACWAHGSLIGTRFREQCARWCPIESCQSGALCGLI
jgi:hypothetical protein